MQIHRLFEIVYILLDKKNTTAGELAERFGVSRRTICRDLDTLSGAGIPVYTQRGKGGGIGLLPGFVLNKSIFSAQEQDEMLSALQGLSTVMTKDTQRVLEKLSTVFSRNTANWLEVDFAGWSYEDDFFNALKTAILEKYQICFDYYNRHGDKTTRRVEPVQLWFKSRTWYLKAFCLTGQGMRLYKLPCIKNLTVTHEKFRLREELNMSAQPLATMFEENNLISIQLKIGQEKAHRVFEDFYEYMVEKQEDGSFIVRTTWPEDEWLYGFILSYGQYIQVQAPLALRKRIQAEAQKVAENHL